MRMFIFLFALALPGWVASQPSFDAAGTVAHGSDSAALHTSGDVSYWTTNTPTDLTIYAVTPTPEELRITGSAIVASNAIIPTAGGDVVATAIYTVGGRRIGHQKRFSYPTGATNYFAEFTVGTLNHALWTNYTANTNGKVSSLWTSQTPGAGAWRSGNLLSMGTNYTALSFAWQGQEAAGKPPLSAISPRLVYSRGHSMGTAGTNSGNAGKLVYFATAAGTQITNAILEQITSNSGGEDWTLFVLSSNLSASITPLAVVDSSAYAAKRPQNSFAPYPVLFSRANTSSAYSGVAPFTSSYTSGDSGSPRMILLGGQLALIGGISTQAGTPAFSNACVYLLQRNGISLANLPTWIDLSSYPTP